MSAAGDAIDAIIARLEENIPKAVYESTVVVERFAKANAPVGEGHKSRSGTKDGGRAGDLRNSIETTGPRPIGVARFAASVGPTVVYGRLRELGGFIPGGATPNPKTGRARLWWKQKGGPWHTAALTHPEGRPYLKPARDAGMDPFRRRFFEACRDAFGRV